MDTQTHQVTLSRVLTLVAEQHGVVSRAQLLDLGMDEQAIKYRLRRGRLHPVHRGVYAVGRPQLARHGTLFAAVLAYGPGAALSHEAAAEVLGIRKRQGGPIDVTVPGSVRKRPGLRVHRAAIAAPERTTRHGIPVTTVVRTLVDLATGLGSDELEAAINEADRLDLIDPERLREAAGELAGRKGARALRRLLDHRNFALTESVLERRFLAIVRRTGLPLPQTQQRVNGFRVDFWWPDYRLVVETDGLRYHRTPLRFTYAQVAHEPIDVERILTAAVRRAPTGRPSAPSPA
jgi:predicted transcriptional regulator of viral defense system